MTIERTGLLLRFAEILARLRWWGVTFALLMTAVLAVPASHLRFDQTIESFFGSKSPLLQPYLLSKQTFGGDEFLIVGFEVEDPTSHDTLDDISALSRELSQIPGILPESMQDLASILRNDRAPGWMRVAMRLPAFKRSILHESRQMLLSADDRTVAIAMRLQNLSETNFPRAETYRKVREAAARHRPPAMVAGEPLQVHDMFQYVEQDSLVLGLASSGLMVLVILLLFRSVRWVILPLVLIHVTLIWTQGLLELSHLKLSMVSSMLTSLVTIIGVATMMHVTLVFKEMRVEFSRLDAYRMTFQRLGRPIIWTCLTTAIGFSALLTSSVVPVRSFAIMMTLATLLIPVLCCLLLPAGILIGKAQSDPAPPLGSKRVSAVLRYLSSWSNRHPRLILVTTFAIALWAVLGLGRLSVETDFSKNFRPDSPIVQAIDYFETRMGGVGSWEIGFSAPEHLSDKFLDRVRDLAVELRELKLPGGAGLTKVISITDGLDLVPKIPLAASGTGRLLPMVRRLRPATLDEKREFLRTLQPEMEPSLYHGDSGRMRIMLRSLERQPAEVKLQVIKEVEVVSRRYFPDAKATGLYVLLANVISSLLDDQLFSFVLAAGGVMLTMNVAFRSIRIGLVSLVPNIFPILVLVGAMSWMSIPLNIGTAMIASVSMGLTVDSTIHYLSSYLRFRQAGDDHLAATENSHGNVGLALVLANVALVVGFSVLMLSNFVPLADFGILVSIAMLGGLVSNIFLMPVLLQWIADPAAAKR